MRRAKSVVVIAPARFMQSAMFGALPPLHSLVAPGFSSVRHAFARATKRLGMAHISPNDLHRSVAHWLLEAGVPRDVLVAPLRMGARVDRNARSDRPERAVGSGGIRAWLGGLERVELRPNPGWPGKGHPEACRFSRLRLGLPGSLPCRSTRAAP